MAFIVGSVIIGAGAALAGGAISAKGSKDAAQTAKEGSDQQIAYNRESRDIAREDQAPYREAGYKALDRLMLMTGLDGPGSYNDPDFITRADDNSSLSYKLGDVPDGMNVQFLPGGRVTTTPKGALDWQSSRICLW
jgi:hypothetical protein